jgi:hypothetical protein
VRQSSTEVLNKFLTDRSGLSCSSRSNFDGVVEVLAKGVEMSFTMLAAAILGCDLLLYAVFTWAYPERPDKRTSRISALGRAVTRFAPRA